MTPSTVTLTLRRGLTEPDCDGVWLVRLRDGTWHMVDVLTRTNVPEVTYGDLMNLRFEANPKGTGELILSDLMVVDCDEEDRDLIPVEDVVEFCGPLPSEPPEDIEP